MMTEKSKAPDVFVCDPILSDGALDGIAGRLEQFVAGGVGQKTESAGASSVLRGTYCVTCVPSGQQHTVEAA